LAPRVERALVAIASHAEQLDGRILRLEHQLEDATIHLPTQEDLLEVRVHSARVAAISVEIAEALHLPVKEREAVRRAALLHDIGKIGVRDAVLLKPGPLDQEEWVEMREHPRLGWALLQRIEFLREASEIVLQHQERFDGSGYPAGLKGEAIVLGARLFAVADTYDVLISNRPYRQAFDNERAVRILREESGTHLWEPAVRALLRSLGERLDGQAAA